jgi:thiol-disulfide isomerase/thioredoxin
MLLPLLLVLSQSDPTDLINKITERHKALKTYHYTWQTTRFSNGPNGADTRLDHGEVVYGGSNKLRFFFDQTPSPTIIASDGTTLWRAALYHRKFVASPVTGDVLNVRTGGNILMMAHSNLRYAELTRPEFLMRFRGTPTLLPDQTIRDGTRLVHCKVIEFKGEYQPSYPFTRKFFIDPDRFVILRDESRTTNRLSQAPFGPGNDTLSITTYTYQALNNLPADTDFSFTPPPDFAQVNSIEFDTRQPLTNHTNQPLPQFSLTDLKGQTVTNADLTGKPTLIHFWATWCAPCREQMPILAQLEKDTRSTGIHFIGINNDESAETASSYATEKGYNWRHLHAPAGPQREAWKVDAIPTIFVVDATGKIILEEVGASPTGIERIRNAIASLK